MPRLPDQVFAADGAVSPSASPEQRLAALVEDDALVLVLEQEATGFQAQLRDLGCAPVPTNELRSGGSVTCCTQERCGL